MERNAQNISHGCTSFVRGPDPSSPGAQLPELRPDLAEQWHPTRNGDQKPCDFTVGSVKKIWWRCPVTCARGCSHDYEQALDKKVVRSTGCPFCAGRQFCVHDSLAGQRPEIAAQWHPTKNNSLQPSDVAVAASQKVWWRCPVTCANGCPHDYEQRIAHKTGGIGCPFCAGLKVCEHDSLAGKSAAP